MYPAKTNPRMMQDNVLMNAAQMGDFDAAREAGLRSAMRLESAGTNPNDGVIGYQEGGIHRTYTPGTGVASAPYEDKNFKPKTVDIDPVIEENEELAILEKVWSNLKAKGATNLTKEEYIQNYQHEKTRRENPRMGYQTGGVHTPPFSEWRSDTGITDDQMNFGGINFGFNPRKPPPAPRGVDLGQGGGGGGGYGAEPSGDSYVPGFFGTGAGGPDKGGGMLSMLERLGIGKTMQLPTLEKLDINILDEAEAGVEKNQDRINKLGAAYDEASAPLTAEAERLDRTKFFKAMMMGGAAMVEAGGPSRDPRTGNMLSAFSTGIQNYAQSLEKDQDRIASLKEKAGLYAAQKEKSMYEAENQTFQNYGTMASKQAEVEAEMQRTQSSRDIVNAQLAQSSLNNKADIASRLEVARQEAQGKFGETAAETLGAAHAEALELYEKGMSADRINAGMEKEEVRQQAMSMAVTRVAQAYMMLGEPQPRAVAMAQRDLQSLQATQDVAPGGDLASAASTTGYPGSEFPAMGSGSGIDMTNSFFRRN